MLTEDKKDVVPVSGLKEVRFAFSLDTLAMLEALAKQLNKSVGEILRDSIALEKFVTDVHAENGRVIVERNGKREELLRA